MERGARYWPRSVAVVDVERGEQGRFTYAQMNDRANRLAAWLRAAGVAPGDRVGLYAQNGVEYLDALFACGKLGATLVPYNWREHWRELVARVEQTTPRVMIFDDAFADSVRELQRACAGVERWLHTRGAGVGGSVALDAIVREGDAPPISHEGVDPEDILCLLFTGGTTGRPKGARVSLRMIAWNTLNTLVHELERGDVTITHTPMFHTGGLLVYTLPLLTVGGAVVIMRKWTADAMLELIERERVTMMFCVPTQYQMMMQSPRFRSCSFESIRFLTSGGAPLPVPVLEAYREQHGVVFKQGFGMTEFGPGIFSMGPEHAVSKAGSIGQPNYFIDARVVDEAGEALAPGEVGELVLKGPSMSSGYHGVHTTPHGAADEDGWFHTGDMARVDEDGFYYIVDRKKDMFISGGENVYPAEVEEVLYRHAAVAQCAVVGVPHPKWGEVGRAFVVLKPGANADEEALLERCRGQLARYKVPKSVVFLDALPTSAAGKILKRALLERGEADDAGHKHGA